MPMNYLPLASLLHQHHCNPVIDLRGSAIREGYPPHRVVCRNSGIAVNTDFEMPRLYIVLEPSIN